MVIIIIVSVILVLVYTSFRITANQSNLNSGIQPFYEGVDAKDSIVHCLSPEITEERIAQEINDQVCLSRIPALDGYEFRQLEFFDCQEMSWTVGDTSNCNKKLFYLLVKEETQLNCLTQLTLCFNEEN